LERAHALGDSHRVYQLVRLLGKRSSPPTSLEGTDPDIWVKHFQQLLGEKKCPFVKASACIKQVESWKVCEEFLTDVGMSVKQWDIPSNAPTQTEILDAAKSARRNKAVAGIIPTELFLNSNLACKILTVLIERIWNGEEIPSSWLNAALCLLYKNKGSKSDPNSFRGISLLSSAEKIMSIVILKRIKAPLEQRLLDPQAGFRSNKSCANAAFVLMRCLEKSLVQKEPRVFTFVDFSKAFDSLDWEVMWKVLEFQGMPDKFVELIRKLYNTSSISVRLSMDGSWAPAFDQKVGIRQGCSLSPALFVLVLDFALRAFESACCQQNIDVDWLGYADDLVLTCSSEALAQQALHQLQAACAFVGLFINVGKTECMAVDVRPAELPKSSATKERVLVRWDHAEYPGWLVDWSGRSFMMDDQTLTSYDLSKFVNTPPTHLLIYDDGESTPVLTKKSGWLMDSDGDKHRFKRLGFREFLDNSKNKFRCSTCSSVFATERGLITHSKTRWCRKKEDLSADQACQLRRTRCSNEKRFGIRRVMIEPVNIVDVDGNRITPVGEFKYLGTLICNQGGSTGEIIRRIQIAASIVSHLQCIWGSAILPLTLKLRLFSAVVASVLLYNCQCWAVSANDVRLLEGFYFRCLRRLSRSTRCSHQLNSDAVDKANKVDVFRVANVPLVESLLRERRLRWLGHVLRSDPQDTTRQCLMREIGTGSSWYKLVLGDLRAVGVSSFGMAERLTADRGKWRVISSARSGPGVLHR